MYYVVTTDVYLNRFYKLKMYIHLVAVEAWFIPLFPLYINVFIRWVLRCVILRASWLVNGFIRVEQRFSGNSTNSLKVGNLFVFEELVLLININDLKMYVLILDPNW